MDKRQQQLSQLKAYTDDIAKEVTLLLQNLQWDPKCIIEKNPMVVCKHDANHRLPAHNRDKHEEKCYLSKLGYGKDDAMLPDPADPDANTLVKFTKDEIAEIFNYAAMVNPTFKRVFIYAEFFAKKYYLGEYEGCEGPEPLTAERLQMVYSADERRVIHDAVVNSAPFCHDLADLDLLSSNNEASTSEKKSRLEILAELRNMKRRRTKYRVAAKTRNYSDVLRDVIKSQMDSYGEATRSIIKTEYGPNMYVSQSVSNNISQPTHSIVKVETVSPESHSYRRTSDNSRERHRARSRDNRYTDDRRGFRKDNSSKDRSHNYNESDQSGQSRDHSTNKSHVERHDPKEKGRKDNHSSKERSNRYDDRHRGSRNYYKDSTSRGKRYDDDRSKYHKDPITERWKKGHNTVIKQERVSQESDSDTTHSRDHYDDRSNSKDQGYRISKNDNNKFSNNERNENHNDRRNDNPERYNPIRAFNIKQEIITPDADHRNKRDGSRKHRKRSRSKDKIYRESKTEYNKEYSHKERMKNHDDRRKDVHERNSPYTVANIKQEKISAEYLENNGEGSRKRYREVSRSEDINVDDKHKRKKDDHSRRQKNESWE